MKKPSRTMLKGLVRSAWVAMENAVAQNSGFRVGAAVLTPEGRIYTGCNVENPSLTMVVCAERVALVKALSEGEREFCAIAVAASGMDYCPPCGSCRQYLYEFAPDILVVMAGGKGYRSRRLKDMLPGAFRM